MAGQAEQSAASNTPFFCGVKLGSIRPDKYCWSAASVPSDYYNTRIAPVINKAIETCSGDLSSEDFIYFKLYMIGTSTLDAVPTVLFISKNAKLRKEVRKKAFKRTRNSEVLSKQSGIKMADYDKDPGCNHLVPLASPSGSESSQDKSPHAKEILFEPSEVVRGRAMPIYVHHGAFIRKATANAIQISDRLYLQSVAHVFEFSAVQDDEHLAGVDDGCEIDYGSDTDSNDNGLDNPQREQVIEETRHSEGQEPITGKCSFAHEMARVRSPSAHSRLIVADLATNSLTDAPRDHAALGEAYIAPISSLTRLGSLAYLSIDKDVALINIDSASVQDRLQDMFSNGDETALAWNRVSHVSIPQISVFAHLTSGSLTGGISEISSYARLPRSATFQETYTVRFNGTLAYGDCGSLVVDSVTGELYGYIIAGCRETGFAHIMAAHHVISALKSAHLTMLEGYTSRIAREDFTAAGPSPRDPNPVPRARKHLPPSLREYRKQVKGRRLTKQTRKTDPNGMKNMLITSSEPAFSWEIFKNRKFQDEEFFAVPKSIGIVRDDLEFFLEPCPSPIPSWKTECIRNYCSRNVEPQFPSYEFSKSVNGLPARGWFDSRVRTNGPLNVKSGVYCPSTLYEALKETRSGEPADIEAYRQLIHITHLNKDYIQALIGSAWYHQAGALRDGIYQHVDRQASLRVYIPYSGFKVFQFECHLPYLALRWKGRPTTGEGVFATVDNRKSWSDLSFLNLENGDSNRDGIYVVTELHSSLILSGWDECKWAAYGFTNAEPCDVFDTFDEEEDQHDAEASGEELDVEDDADLDELNGDYDLYAANEGPEDHLASDGRYGLVAREDPVWDPRLYFLRLTDFRLRMVRKEWSYLVSKIVANLKTQNVDLTYPFSGTPSEGKLTAEVSLAWLTRLKNFLNELLQELHASIRPCERFLAPDGDHTYFEDDNAQVSKSSLRTIVVSIRYSYRCLVDLEKRLASLERSCSSSKETIEFYMSIQHHKENALLIQEANALSREANALSGQANELSRRTKKLTVDANSIAAGNSRVAAANNLNAALMLNMNQVMTPVVVVLGYFSIEGEIFGFPKTSWSFVISVAVAFVTLYLCNLLIFFLRHRVKNVKGFTWLFTGQLDQLLLDRGDKGVSSLVDQDHVVRALGAEEAKELSRFA